MLPWFSSLPYSGSLLLFPSCVAGVVGGAGCRCYRSQPFPLSVLPALEAEVVFLLSLSSCTVIVCCYCLMLLLVLLLVVDVVKLLLLLFVVAGL